MAHEHNNKKRTRKEINIIISNNRKKKKKKRQKEKKTVSGIKTSDIRFNILCSYKKPLSMHNLIEQSVNRKVPSGIIHTHNNLLHLDPGLFHY